MGLPFLTKCKHPVMPAFFRNVNITNEVLFSFQPKCAAGLRIAGCMWSITRIDHKMAPYLNNKNIPRFKNFSMNTGCVLQLERYIGESLLIILGGRSISTQTFLSCSKCQWQEHILTSVHPL